MRISIRSIVELTFLEAVFTLLLCAQQKPITASPDIIIQSFSGIDVNKQDPIRGSNFPTSVSSVSLAGGNRLVSTQYTDGGWGWPLAAPPTYANIIGPIGVGLAQAYQQTGNALQRTALMGVGTYLLAKTNNFSPSDGYLAAQLDKVLCSTVYTSHVKVNFYDKLENGTYNRLGYGTLYTTSSYVSLIRASRAGQGIPNLAAWDLGMGLVGAAMCGASIVDWVAGVKAEINELNGSGYYDVVGLAGALYGLAFVNEDFDPTAGQHSSASNINDLAVILAGYQISGGGFTWNSNNLGSGNETNQETAYAILALNEVNRTTYLAAIQGAANYLMGVQLGSGGWDDYVGDPDGENNELTGEALWGINVAYPAPVPGLAYTGGPQPTALVVLEAQFSNWPGGVSGATVSFAIDGVSVGSAVTNTSGTAALNIGSRTVGVYNVEATTALGCLVANGLLAVYDPTAGFVTGGGWITSPLGAYPPDPTLTGKATFGFVSKYVKGKTVPTGNTEFQFRLADFNFKSTAYEWLVIAGPKAQYKGVGMINGTGDYGFMLTAIDGQINGGGGSDKFRIKVWERSSSTIVYDNQMGAPDTDPPTTVIDGGSIVIQKSGGGKLPAGEIIPTEYTLFENYPNPFNPSTTIQFDLPEESRVSVAVYDILGREVVRLVDETMEAGRYRQLWESQDHYGKTVSSGVYFVRIEARSVVSERNLVTVGKMLLMK